MADDIYTLETDDWKVVKGDTLNIYYSFKDSDGVNLDITSYQTKFSVIDPLTEELIADFSKTHNEAISGGNGVYYYGDTQAPANLGLTASNQLAVVLSYFDTNVDAGIYPFDIEFTDGNSKKTAVKGNLIITEEVTPSVS